MAYYAYYFKKGKRGKETQKRICAVYGEGDMTDWMCQKWFARFHAGDVFAGQCSPVSRPVEVDSDQIRTLVEINVLWHGRQPTYSKSPNQ